MNTTEVKAEHRFKLFINSFFEHLMSIFISFHYEITHILLHTYKFRLVSLIFWLGLTYVLSFLFPVIKS